MRKFGVGLGMSMVLLLTGCGSTEDLAEAKESKVEEKASSSETAAASKTKEEKQLEVVLESPYKEIKAHFDEYELPKEGIINEGATIEYENGYTFNKETKALSGRKWNEDGTVNAPTEEQKTGVVMGFLYDAAALGAFEDMTVSNSNEQMHHPISRLKQVQELSEFEPLDQWAKETAELLDKAQNMEYGEARQALLKEGYDELQKMSSLIEG